VLLGTALQDAFSGICSSPLLLNLQILLMTSPVLDMVA